MDSYPNLRARYSKGSLKLRKPLNLPDGTEVRVTVTPPATLRKHRSVRSKRTYATRSLPPDYLQPLVGVVSLGGDALVDSETLYDGS